MKKSSDSSMKIAVIGAGISGICAAFLLQKKHRVTLYEKNDYFGGHTHTVILPDGPDKGTPVDTGFIVLNKKTYPNFIRFLSHLGVRIQETDMSFSYYCKQSGNYYASRNLNTLFARRINIIKPAYWLFVYEMLRFLKTLRRNYLENNLDPISLGDYIGQKGFHHTVVREFIIPMAAAIWSGSDMEIKAFPVRAFAQFYENHGLLSVSHHPPWYFVEGGSHSYVKAFLHDFKGRAVKDARVCSVRREANMIILDFDDRARETYDAVVIATHADQALSLLDDPGDDETRLLGLWKYSQNEILLHRDYTVMPPDKRAWASWNYTRETSSDEEAPVMVSYDMNRLQNLNASRNYFVTLNPRHSIDDHLVISKMTYSHPQYSFDAFETQKDLPGINGRQNTFFCGSYFGYGFHEDGVNAALAVADKFGLSL